MKEQNLGTLLRNVGEVKARTFKKPNTYQELVWMLNQFDRFNQPAFSYLFIANFFMCDHKAVIYHARKIGIPTGKRNKNKLPYLDPRHPILKEERVNPGKRSYADYLMAERERTAKRIIVSGVCF